jgi:hypothetical protein
VTSLGGIAADANGAILLSAQTPSGPLIFGMSRHFGHLTPYYTFVDASHSNSAVPIPFVESVSQRRNTTLVDIDYRVNDPDSPVVTTGLLAFRGSVADDSESLANVIKLTSLVENTETNRGPNQTANITHRVTWDASEASTDFDNFQFLVLANDDRPLLDFRFITIPASGSDPELTMSSDAVSDERLLGIWFWLIATKDPAITFTNGVVNGVAGPFAGQMLASGRTTTSSGRALLYQKLNVTNASPGQISRAQRGNYGFVSVDVNSVVKLP